MELLEYKVMEKRQAGTTIQKPWISSSSLRKSSIIFLFYAILIFPVYAQPDTLVNENFNRNHNGWDITDNRDYTTTITNGKFLIRKYSGPVNTFTIQRFVDDAKDFILQADITLPDSSVDLSEARAGLVWGQLQETKQHHSFTISSDGYYQIYTDHRQRDVGKKIKTSLVKTGNQTNTLRIAQQQGVLHFFLNDVLVGRQKPLPWFGTDVGIITFFKGELHVDNFMLLSESNINLSPTKATGIVRENIGAGINSRYPEIHPLISADGKTLYFARKHSPDNIGGSTDKQDIWVSTSPDGLHWRKGKNMGADVNSIKADNLTAVSADNNVMMFYRVRNDRSGGFRVRKKTETGWSADEPLDLHLTNESEFIESCLSPNGRTILYTAKTKKNVKYKTDVDERDIYVCFKKEKGRWAKPLNIGPVVNTAGDEFSPYLAADGRTLYFGSNGRPGYGRVDIFMTRRLDDTWTNWTEPINLGPEINTPLFDAYYTLPASGNYAYLVSIHERYGDTDIIRVKLPEELRPNPVVLLQGFTLSNKTKQPVQAIITVEDAETRKGFTETISDLQGYYSVVLPYGRKYHFYASAKGYLPAYDSVALTHSDTYKEIEKNLHLIPLTVGEVLALQNVFFKKGKATLKTESYTELNRLANLMDQNRSMEIELSGHTDNIGNPEALLKLSRERVETVKKYLMQKGISGKRIKGKGYGAAQPLLRNDTEENRKKNRRVEVKITSV
ncbi:MAG TPA: OmpA family protein [Ohtaekwangia sp.]|nr:OmpA family protein [Ohtaekwangia sp.]